MRTRTGSPLGLLLLALVVVAGASVALEPGAEAVEASPSVASLAEALGPSLAEREYLASTNAHGLQAPNRAHRLRTWFEPTGVRVADRKAPSGTSLVSLSLLRLGRPGSMVVVPAGTLVQRGARVEIARPGLGVVEWYENSSSGLEQGFTVERRPAGGGRLALDVRVRGASVSRFGDALVFRSDAGRALRYGKLQVEDRAGRPLSARFELDPVGFRIAVDDAGAAYPIVVDPLLTASFESELESNQLGAEFGESVASAGDVNGDGFADVIVGADSFDAGEADEGAAFVFLGSATGIVDPGNPLNAHAVIEGDQVGAQLGQSVAAAGDVDGDGYGDVIVGATFWESEVGQADEGAAFVYYGSAAGLVTTSADVIQSDKADARLGFSAQSAGDVDGDGYADVIVGAYRYGAADEGAAFVFHGGPGGIGNRTPATADTRLEALQGGSEFGRGVSGAGDVNGDGLDDVIVGAPFYDDGQNNEGAAFVYHGNALGIPDGTELTRDTFVASNQVDARMGFSVASAGDWNRDGFDDVIVGAERLGPVLFEEGGAFIYLGSAIGVSPIGPITITSFQDSARLGRIVDSAGDVNGDGFADVIVGAHQYDAGQNDEGAAFVFLGRDDPNPYSIVAADAYAQLESDQADALLGFSVAGAGDVNGDGFDDVIAGAVFMDTPQIDEGAAFVYHVAGRASRTASPPTATGGSKRTRWTRTSASPSPRRETSTATASRT